MGIKLCNIWKRFTSLPEIFAPLIKWSSNWSQQEPRTEIQNAEYWRTERYDICRFLIFFGAISGHLTVPSSHIFIKNTRCLLTWSSWKIHVWWSKYRWFVKIKNNKVTKEEKKILKSFLKHIKFCLTEV